MDHDHGLGLRSHRTPGELVEIAALAAVCGACEGIDLSFVSEMARTYAGEMPQALFHDRGHLVSAVALQDDGHDLEATLLVHPDYRRRGLGRVLLATIVTASERRGLTGLMLVGAEGGASAAAFAAAVGAHYRFSEYRMAQLVPPEPSPPPAIPVHLRPVTPADFAVFARVAAAAFGKEEEVERRFVSDLNHPDRRLYLALHETEPVGVVRAVRQVEETYITTLGVLPAWRRRGLGRQILIQAIALLEAANWRPLVLEVATDNQRALALYHARGFRATSGYAYYHLALAQGADA